MMLYNNNNYKEYNIFINIKIKNKIKKENKMVKNNLGNIVFVAGILMIVGLGVLMYNIPDHNDKLAKIQAEHKSKLATKIVVK